jgi:hypothetical protein
MELQILKEAVEIMMKFPKDKEVFKEQSKIIRRTLKEMKNRYFYEDKT